MKRIVKTLRKNLFGIVFWVVILGVFLSVSSLLVIRASGYAYNFQTKKFQKTGLIYIRTIPSGADVYLDGNIISKRTPLRISYLLPGSYSVEVKKDGYQSVNKTPRVYGGLVSEYRNLILFKNKLTPNLLTDLQVSDFILSPGKTKVFFREQDSLKILDLKRQTSSDPISFSNLETFIPIELLKWTTNSSILAKSNDQLLLLNITKKTVTNFSKYFTDIKKVEIVSNSRAIIQASQILYEFNLDKLKKSVIAENVGGFATMGQNIYYLQSEQKKINLIYLTTLRKTKLFSTTKLPLQTEIYVSPDRQIVFRTPDLSLYYLDSKNGDRILRLISTDVKEVIWSKVRETFSFREKYKLLFSREKEIWLFQKGGRTITGELEEKRIITRLDTAIQNLGFFKFSNYFFYQTNDVLYIMDDEGMSFEIIKTQSLSLDFDKNFKELFYLSDSGNLVRAQIR